MAPDPGIMVKPCVQKRPINDCRVRMQRRFFSVTVSESSRSACHSWTWRQPAVKRTTEYCSRLHPRRSWKTRCTGGGGADCTDSADVIVLLLDTLSAAPGCCQRTIVNDHVQIMSQKLIRSNRANRTCQVAIVRSQASQHPTQRWDSHTCLL